MKVNVAGFNIDIELLKKASKLMDNEVLTPETISAAYARISRDPRSVDELRANAITDVVKARASNEQIVFGLGHASVAEHAVFNFDIMGVSRLAIEAIEHARLASYTEKSQRYTKLGEEFVMPQEIIEAGLGQDFREMIIDQHIIYQKLFQGIRDYLLSQIPKATKEEQKAIDGRAKEDARYVTSLAVEGQLGMTCNARNLEYMISRLLCHPLHEVKAIGTCLYSQTRDIAPSLLKYFEPSKEKLQSMSDLQNLANEVSLERSSIAGDLVKLLSYDKDGDDKVMSALIHDYTNLDIGQCMECWQQLEPEQGKRLFKSVFGSLQPWSSVPRAFELADFQFELTVSASCFAQLKRHRIATILPQRYDVSLGYTIPSSIQEANLEHIFEVAMKFSSNMYDKLIQCGLLFAAPYALTQAHRRRVIVKMNARELYHFSRLRQDGHAQWDIRNVANQMIKMAKQVCPLTMSLACGKDSFEQEKKNILEEKC